METTSLHHCLASKPPLLTINPQRYPRISLIFFSPRHQRPVRIRSINGSGSDGDNTCSDSAPPQVPPPITPPETVEVRFRRRSRRRSKQESEDGAMVNGRPRKAQVETSAPERAKKWEDMSVTEKAIELYMGEKGLLYWLNKFAYASIFIVIGGWILFRFVGPSLNLYQLDTPPLSPTSMF